MTIVTGNSYFNQTFKVRYQSHMLKLMQRHGIGPKGLVEGNLQEAIVRQGRWVLLCANSDCRGAELAWEEGFLYCASCLNAHVDHKMLMTKFPKERREIEAILEPRNIPNRNWELGETLVQLRAENEEHGIALPNKAGGG